MDMNYNLAIIALDASVILVDTVIIALFLSGKLDFPKGGDATCDTLKKSSSQHSTNASHAAPTVQPASAATSLSQQDFDFWFAECCRLHRLAEQAHEWEKWPDLWRLINECRTAQRRFDIAQKNLLRGTRI